jgi:hypothetical protein
LSPAIDEVINRTVAAKVSSLSNELQVLKTSSNTFSNNLKKTGFAQSDSKDFNVSKFVKDLDRITLANDSLQAYEHFWDSILHAFNSICNENQVFPYYKDLKKDFDFKPHLCANPRFNPSELLQVKLNYRSFGDTLRLYLLTPSVIPKATCPKASLKLLSLKGVKDGFKLLRELIFQLSPQLDGIFIDFGTSIASLTILNGEHLSEFYSRVQDLSHEICLANLPDGNAAALHHRFLFLLRQTGCPTILSVTQPYWAKITIFRRNPNHYTIPKLPWDLHALFNELEASDISILSSSSPNSPTTSLVNDDLSPISSNTLSFTTTPIAALGTTTTKSVNNLRHRLSPSGHPYPTQKPKTFAIHHTSDGRRFLSEQSSSTRPNCDLCHNKHPNPWHDTSNCPLKHPTFIIDKNIRERVMQHNALHGSENKKFSKNQDHQNHLAQPPTPSPSGAQANRAVTITDHSPDNTPPPTTDTTDSSIDPPDLTIHEIINTDIFEVPSPPQANMASTSSPNIQEDFTLDDSIFDSTQYLSYDS